MAISTNPTPKKYLNLYDDTGSDVARWLVFILNKSLLQESFGHPDPSLSETSVPPLTDPVPPLTEAEYKDLSARFKHVDPTKEVKNVCSKRTGRPK